MNNIFESNQQRSLVINRLNSWKLISDYRFIMVVTIIIRLFVLNNARGVLHPDEQFQGLEIAYYILNPETVGKNIPWEFTNATRSYLWVYIVLPIVWLTLTLGIRGVNILIFIRLLFNILNLFSINYFLKFVKSDIDKTSNNGIQPSVAMGWFLATCAPLLLLVNHISPDSFSISMLFFLIPMMTRELKDKNSLKQKLLMGVLIGLTISLRFQFVLFFVPFVLNILYNKRIKPIIGILIGFLPLAIFDLLYYGVPLITAFNFFMFNVIHQTNAEVFLVLPSWIYLAMFFGFNLVFGIIIIIILYSLGRRRIIESKIDRSIIIGLILYIIFFQILKYKEVKFILPAFVLISLFSIFGITNLNLRIIESRFSRAFKISIIIYFIFSSLIIFIIPIGLNQNMMTAQEELNSIDPNASVFIMDDWALLGGKLIQNPDHPENEIYYINGIYSLSNEEILTIVNYTIIDQNNDLYQQYKQLMINNCDNLELIKEFNEEYINPLIYILMSIVYDVNNDKVEIWTCNL